MWGNPAERFIHQLKHDNLTRILKNKELLSSLRYDWEGFRHYSLLYQKQITEREIDFEKEVRIAWETSDPRAEAVRALRTPSRQFAFLPIPDSSHKWSELQLHRDQCALLRRERFSLPSDIIQEILDFRGPNQIHMAPERLDDSQCPWGQPGIVTVPQDGCFRY